MWTFSTEVTDDDLRQAYEWHVQTPHFLQSLGKFENSDDFIKEVKSDRRFKGMVDGQYKGLVLGEIKNENVIEGHLYCERGLGKDFLTALIMFAKTESLKTYKQVLIEIPTKSKGLQRLIDKAGFHNLGLSKWGDVVRGKLLETQFYLAES